MPVPLQTQLVPAPGAQLTDAAGGVRSILTSVVGGLLVAGAVDGPEGQLGGAVGLDGVGAADRLGHAGAARRRSASAGPDTPPAAATLQVAGVLRQVVTPQSTVSVGIVLSMPIVSARQSETLPAVSTTRV